MNHDAWSTEFAWFYTQTCEEPMVKASFLSCKTMIKMILPCLRVHSPVPHLVILFNPYK